LCLRFISVDQVDLPRSYPSRRDDQKWKKGQIRLTPRRGRTTEGSGEAEPR
jgi:hypothetical protein